MATTPAAIPNPNSPSHPDPGVHALGAVARVQLAVWGGSDDWREKEAVKRIRAVLPRRCFFMDLVGREGVDMRKSLICNHKAFGPISC